MRKLIFVFLALTVTLSSFAQKSKKDKREENRKRVNALIRQEEEGVIAYRKHTVFGGKLTSDGYGIFMEVGRAKTVRRAMLFQLELSERKDIHEEKGSTNFGGNITNPFIYAKQNFFYPVKIGLQQQILLGNKSNKNGVSVSGNFGGGVSLGLLRPYYVQLNSSEKQYIKYENDTTGQFLNLNEIVGGPGFTRGWSDLKVTPGAYVKTALRFDYGSYNEMVSAIEVGLTGEYYSKKVPIMVTRPAKQFFFTGYVAIMFGRRK